MEEVEQPVGVECGWCPIPLITALKNLGPDLSLGIHYISFFRPLDVKGEFQKGGEARVRVSRV